MRARVPPSTAVSVQVTTLSSAAPCSSFCVEPPTQV
jgi:hypothetical protein